MSETTTCTSIVFTGKQTLELTTSTLGAPKEDEVLVEATRTLISTGTEMTIFNRNFEPGTHWDQWVCYYPFPVGYLFSGRVVKVGSDKTGFKVGDRVGVRHNHSSHVIAKAINVIRVPDNVSDDESVWLGLGKIVQNGVRAADHKLGDTVVIIGLGMLGQLVTRYARINGASEVIAIDTAPKRLELAKLGGATATLNMSAADAKAEVLKLTNGLGADVVYDVTGHPAVLATALKLARKAGTIQLLGDSGAPGKQMLGPEIITHGLKIIGTHDNIPPHFTTEGVRWSGTEIYDLFLKYVGRKQMNVNELITHRFKPQQAAQAYDLLNKDRANVMGVMFEWK